MKQYKYTLLTITVKVRERCKTIITSLLYISQLALNLVKFIKIAVSVINLCKETIIIYNYIIYNSMHANKLLIGLENSRDRSFKTKITNAKTKTAKFRSGDQDRGLEDYISAF